MGQKRVVFLPSPRAMTINGQGTSHSRYFFSRSSINEKKGQPMVVTSRLAERDKLYTGKNSCCQVRFVVPIPIVWLAKKGHSTKNFLCPPKVSISPNPFVLVVISLCS